MKIKDKNIIHTTYSLEELKSFFEVVDVKENGCFCIRSDEGPMLSSNTSWRYFAVLSFQSSNMDGSDARYECFWFGEGPSDGLRECRHSWFGSSEEEQDGYVFYINRKLMNDAFEFLSTYYDLD